MPSRLRLGTGFRRCPVATVKKPRPTNGKHARATTLDDVPEPPSPTGLYPGPVWAEAAGEDDDVPEPPSPTGLYPGPVWAEGTAYAQAAEDANLALKEADYS